ncbi:MULTISPECIES: mycofactocin system FadH/OYE family oxidoreductase 2 [unclassified Rhodococcus (in: high G+C Gram-positive bacteria)]|uniref:mycofactocin system FadH/OYE family oxidoreductase 2 n=1 Tax=unclassified Rhodococcus (in: high G+C Gram-positive bacteria) TaxID=192944 RepID=UPI0009295817|nr:mycofactocin system FadH/OYE family oxidoreductase 2 [Rhodococcus sp. M8]OLL16908.1 2,4-dienoyl-CoA reductase [Rhodococcus sp. M8]QPG46981.1 mycofactocin system FadH/OYE family oxidoreductase 2 [Rhodococcus sp. M8]
MSETCSAGPHPRLAAPLRLGPVTLRNRVVFSAHLTNFAEDGLPTAQHAAYYAARAGGGAGLIVSEEHTVHPTDRPYEKLIRGYDPAVVSGYRRITDAVHARGGRIFAQLNHNGAQGCGMYTGLPLWAPSAVPDPLFREVPKALEEHEIRDLVEGYARVAEHCRAGGFDGVELQCSQASIVRQFLSPGTNLRTDRYGGPLRNRARFLLEVVGALRAAVGSDLVVGVRLSGHDGTDGGITLDDAVAVAAMIEDSGHVDYLNTSIGVATETLHLIEASMATPHGYALFVPDAIRRRVRLPVVGVGRFTTPAQAEAALAEGRCDLVGVVRGQIADPDFAAKALAGDDEAVRPCLACNQECIGRVGLGRWIGCVENPRAGREAQLLPDPAVPGRRVLVVGGGPAGLRAAATAAQRGHRVTLCERTPALGGQIRTAATAPGRGELAGMVDSLEVECRRAGVDVRIGVHVDAAFVQEHRPDAVVVATGARPRRPDWAGDTALVVDVRDVLDGRVSPQGDVLVVDDLGFHQATSVAALLAGRGAAVTVCTAGMIVGQDLGLTLDMEDWTRRAHAEGIAQLTDTLVTAVTETGGRLDVALWHHPTAVAHTRTVDAVVVATHQDPVDDLWVALRDGAFHVVRIGDAVTPRRAHAAIVEGERAAVGL